jgi:hypothetical protein
MLVCEQKKVFVYKKGGYGITTNSFEQVLIQYYST